jgi:signal transduction histidine kinase
MVIKINKEFLKEHDVTYQPAAVKGIKDFDSLFSTALQKDNIAIQYSIHKQSPADTIFYNPAYTYSSQPLVINFHEPSVYRIDYNILPGRIFIAIMPFIVSGIVLLVLLAAAFLFMKRSYRLQTEMSTFRESLLSNVTHELKTPLSSLQLILETAQKTRGNMSAAHLEYAANELSRMKLTVDKILSFGRMNQEQVALDKELIDVNALIQEAITATNPMVQQYAAEIHFTQGDKLLLVADRTLLLSALITVIDNALKYSSEKPHINIAIKSTDSNIIITIADKGIGIAPQYHQKIFEPFFRVPSGNVHDVKGHGLGLSFVAQVMVFHKGSISVESNNDGSSFIFSIPVNK